MNIINNVTTNVGSTANNISATTGLSYPVVLICMLICCFIVYKITKKVIHIIFTVIAFAIILMLLQQFGIF